MPQAVVWTWITVAVVLISLNKETQAAKWMNLGAITLPPVNDQLYSKQKTAYWLDSTLKHKVHKAERLDSKSTDVQHSIRTSTASSSIHTWPSSSISHKETLNTSQVPVASTDILDRTQATFGEVNGKDVTEARAKGPIVSSLASVLAIGYWQNQRKKCCLTRLCPCRQYPYSPNAGSLAPPFIAGLPPQQQMPPFAPSLPGSGYPPGAFLPPFFTSFRPGQSGLPGSMSPGGGNEEGEEELESGFQGSYEVHTPRPTKRRRPIASHHHHYHPKPNVILRPISMSGLSSSATGHSQHPINGLMKWSAVPSSDLSPSASASGASSSSPSSPSTSLTSHIAHSPGLFTPSGRGGPEKASFLSSETQVQVDSVSGSAINGTVRAMRDNTKEQETTSMEKNVRTKRRSPILPPLPLSERMLPEKDHTVIPSDTFTINLLGKRFSHSSFEETISPGKMRVYSPQEPVEEEIDQSVDKSKKKSVKKRIERMIERTPLSSGSSFVAPAVSGVKRPFTGTALAMNGQGNRGNARKSSGKRQEGSNVQGINGNSSGNLGGFNAAVKAANNGPSRGGGGTHSPSVRKNRKKSTNVHTSVRARQSSSPRLHASRNSQRDTKD